MNAEHWHVRHAQDVRSCLSRQAARGAQYRSFPGFGGLMPFALPAHYPSVGTDYRDNP